MAAGTPASVLNACASCSDLRLRAGSQRLAELAHPLGEERRAARCTVRDRRVARALVTPLRRIWQRVFAGPATAPRLGRRPRSTSSTRPDLALLCGRAWRRIATRCPARPPARARRARFRPSRRLGGITRRASNVRATELAAASLQRHRSILTEQQPSVRNALGRPRRRLGRHAGGREHLAELPVGVLRFEPRARPFDEPVYGMPRELDRVRIRPLADILGHFRIAASSSRRSARRVV